MICKSCAKQCGDCQQELLEAVRDVETERQRKNEIRMIEAMHALSEMITILIKHAKAAGVMV
jgi:hypothetical protein